MNNITLVTDSTWDRSIEVAEEKGVRVVPLNIHFDEEHYLDGIDLTMDEFISKLKTSKNSPTTSQPSPHQFEQIFREELEKGNKVIYIGIDSSLSGTVNSANLAKESLESEDIYIVDSKSVTAGLALMVEIAYNLIKEKEDAEEIVNELNEIKKNLRIYAYVDTLKYLQKTGRLSSSKAIIGGILNVKPILQVKDGRITSFDKARGKKTALNRIAEIVNEKKIDTKYPVSFAHINSIDELNMLKDLLLEDNDIKKTWIQNIGTVVAINSGPGAVAVAFIKQ